MLDENSIRKEAESQVYLYQKDARDKCDQMLREAQLKKIALDGAQMVFDRLNKLQESL